MQHPLHLTHDRQLQPDHLNPSPYLNYRWKFVPQPLGDSSLNNFYFSPDYHVDEMFFRHIMGTVTNAVYFKPSVAYWLDVTEGRQLGGSLSLIYSLAPVPVSTPGNGVNYGIEMDVNLGYRNIGEKFYAGMVWGVSWPRRAQPPNRDLRQRRRGNRHRGPNPARLRRDQVLGDAFSGLALSPWESFIAFRTMDSMSTQSTAGLVGAECLRSQHGSASAASAATLVVAN